MFRMATDAGRFIKKRYFKAEWDPSRRLRKDS